MGETRDERLQEFVVINPEVPVVGMREGAWLQVEGTSMVLGGGNGARLYLGSEPAVELEAGADLSRFS
jgi:dipeptidase E